MWRYCSIVSSGCNGVLCNGEFLQAKQRATNRPNAEISITDCFLHLVPEMRPMHNAA